MKEIALFSYFILEFATLENLKVGSCFEHKSNKLKWTQSLVDDLTIYLYTKFVSYYVICNFLKFRFKILL